MKKSVKIKPLRIISKAFLTLWCAFSVFSLLWVCISSFKTNKEFFSKPWELFNTAQIQNYINVWSNYRLGTYYLNSIFVVALSVALIVIVSTLAAYIVARVGMNSVKIIGRIFIFGMGVPNMLLLVPLFFLLNDLRLRNSLIGLALVYTAVSIPFSIFLISGFFKNLPHELEEAAFVDGCGPMPTFFRIMLPLGRPGIITATIFNFITLWNEFLLSYTFIDNDKSYTLSIGLYGLNSSMQYTGEWTTLMAGIVLIIIPTLFIYLLLSRQIIEGMTFGAVKG